MILNPAFKHTPIVLHLYIWTKTQAVVGTLIVLEITDVHGMKNENGPLGAIAPKEIVRITSPQYAKIHNPYTVLLVIYKGLTIYIP